MKENWTYKKLGEVASFVKDGDWIESRYQSENGLRLIQTGNVGNGSFKAKEDKPHYISEKTFTELGCTEIYSGDCLVSRLPEPIGRACIIPNVNYRMITAVDCTIIRFKDIMNPHFFVYYTKSKEYEREINNHTTGTTRKRISRKNLESVCIPVPPIEIQHRIVSELDLLQSIIDKQQAQLKELDTLAQAVFYDMFGDPVENEKGWEVKKLGEECTDMKYGTSRPSSENGQYPYLRMCNISYDGYLDLNNLKTIDIPKDEIDKCLVKYGDILFNRTNSIELIGKTCMFDLETPMVIAGYIIRVRLSNKLEPRFISRMFNLPSIKKLLREMAKGAVNQANINSKELASIDIPVPPLSLQQSFASKIESIEKQKATIAQSITETQKLFNYTMDKYFG